MVGRVFLGRYEAIRLLGEGGMGRVYLARQLDLGRQVVVKVMHDHVAADAKFRERFQRETLLMARFQHPYAVTLYDASLNDPQGPCIVMEYIRGITLDVLLERNTRLTPERTGRLLGQLCEVLQAAHSAGIIHRDLKPANLMVVDPDTPYEMIKVMDFGLAKLIDTRAVKNISSPNAEFAIGTPGYMSPEQAKGEEMDHRGDLYSVGVILYQLLSGRLPFAGRSTIDTLIAHATEEPPSFAEVGAGDWVPPAIEAVVRSCLAKDPADRPASARDLAERYETALAHEQAVHEASLPPHPDAPYQNGAAKAPSRGQESGVRGQAGKEFDPTAVVHQLDAWMPEKVAAYKLRGFVQDVGGKVIESVPGRIRVRLGGRGSVYGMPARNWLGLRHRSGWIDMELLLQRGDPQRNSMLNITVILRPADASMINDPEVRELCSQIFIDLRGYLMGSS
ncbi:MAG TPA: serine/threonine-protein kinase [Gemmataceae bacterium]|nr:serine/threonine-protein kinase [Gemmataceae bacterium]